LCDVKMLDLHLCLSASVNVRYILHTTLGLYNKILVWVSLYPSLSLYLSLLDYPSHLLHLLATVACYPFTSPSFSFLSYQLLLFRWQKVKSASCQSKRCHPQKEDPVKKDEE
jgi:hypothetical protein